MDYKSFSDEISRIVRPQSYPLGIKLFKGKDILPKEAVRPSKYGVKISLCQWTTMARRWGRILAAETTDISCTPCLAALGMKKMGNISDLVEYFLEMGYFATREAAEVAVRKLAPLSAGAISGIAFSPLHISPFEPDVIVIYGTPAQMARMAAGYVYHTGELIESQTTGFGISCLSAVKPFFTGKPAFVHPGRGERILAGTDEAEMFFTFPAINCDRFLEGLRKTEANGTRYPVQSFLLYQPPILQPLKNLGDKLTEA